MTGKKFARQNEIWGGGTRRRRRVRPHVRKAAERAFLMASILISSAMLLFCWIASKP